MHAFYGLTQVAQLQSWRSVLTHGLCAEKVGNSVSAGKRLCFLGVLHFGDGKPVE